MQVHEVMVSGQLGRRKVVVVIDDRLIGGKLVVQLAGGTALE